MATELTWLGHGSWSIRIGSIVVLLDPYFDESPTAPVKSTDVDAHYILVSHGHFDHVTDAAPIAHRTGATVIANYEIALWLGSRHRVENTIAMNLGGQIQLPFGTLKMTMAWHSSQLPDGSDGGSPAGFLLKTVDGTIYFACDTALFADMQRIAGRGVDLAVLPIGDLFTMGPADSIEAIRLINPTRVLPNHYNTWPPIAQDPHAWAEAVRAQTSAEPIVLEPGGTISL